MGLTAYLRRTRVGMMPRTVAQAAADGARTPPRAKPPTGPTCPSTSRRWPRPRSTGYRRAGAPAELLEEALGDSVLSESALWVMGALVLSLRARVDVLAATR
jgi:hypothetical protein